jgi:tetratricopeptide (TPR) repeat protein
VTVTPDASWSPVEQLAIALSTAALIEPALIRAVRLEVLPHLDAGAEGDFWFSQLISTRTPRAVSLRVELLPDLRHRLSQWLGRGHPGEPVHRIGRIIADRHAGLAPALRLEEGLAWQCVTEPHADPAVFDALLQPALRALVEDGRIAVADWFTAAWRRLPPAVRDTRTAWQIRQVASWRAARMRSRAAVEPTPPPAGLTEADVAAVVGVIDDAALALVRRGGELRFGVGSEPDASVILVPDTDPRMVEICAERAPEVSRTVFVDRDRAVAVAVPDGALLLTTARGAVYRLADGGAAGDAAAGPRTRTAVGVVGLPRRNPHFAGREAVLEQVRTGLAADVRRPVALIGPSGAGTTQIAVEFAHRHASEYDGVWWLPTDDPGGMRVVIAEMGGRVGAEESDGEYEVAAVVEALRQVAPMTLVILDGAPVFPAEVPRRLVRWRGPVLVTTFSAAWGEVAYQVPVDILTAGETTAVLRRYRPDLTDREAGVGPRSVARIPFAAAQVGAWLAATGRSVDQLSAMVDERLPAASAAPYPSMLVALLRTVLAHVGELIPGSDQLLQMLAFFRAGPVSTAILRAGGRTLPPGPLAGLLDDDVELSRALSMLARFALVHLDDAGSTVLLHPLLENLLSNVEFGEPLAVVRQRCHAVLAAADPGAIDDEPSLRAHARLAPYVVRSGLVNSRAPRARRLVLRQIHFRQSVGDHHGALSLAATAVDTWTRQSGMEDPSALLAEVARFHTQRAMGDPPPASLYEELIARVRRAFGEENTNLLTLMMDAAARHRLDGDFGAALDKDVNCLLIGRRTVASAHPVLRRAVGAIVTDRRLLGDFDVAAAEGEALAAEYDRDFGRADDRTVGALVGLAFDRYGQGRYLDALAVLQSLLAILPRTNDAELDLRVRRVFTGVIRKSGQARQAAELAERCAGAAEARLGTYHAGTLAARNTFALALKDAGRLGEAVAVGRRTLDGYRTRLRPWHPLTLVSQLNLATILRRAGDDVEARKAVTEAADGLRGSLGRSHPYTLYASLVQANSRSDSMDYAGALRLLDDTLVLGHRVLAPDHPDLLFAALNRAIVARHYAPKSPASPWVGLDGAVQEAQTQVNEAAAALHRIIGPSDQVTADVRALTPVDVDVEMPWI